MQLSPKARRGLVVGGAVALFAAVVGAASCGPLVRSRAQAEAKRRGIELEIESVRPGWGSVWLRGVRVQVPEVPAMSAELDAVEVDIGLGLGVDAVRVHGGRVAVRGSATEVAGQLRKWRSRRSSGGSAGSRREYSLEGVHVAWHDDEQSQHLWGVSYQREADGSELVEVDLGHLTHDWASVEVHGARVSVGRSDGRRVVRRLTTEALIGRVELGQAVSPAAAAVGPTGSADQGASDAAEAAEAEAAKPVAAKPHGPESEGKRTKPPFPSVEARRRGPKLRAAFERIARAVAAGLPVDGELDLAGLRLELRRGKQRLKIGPARLRARRSPERVTLILEPGSRPSKDTPLQFRLELPLVAGPVKLALHGGPISLAALGMEDGNFGLTNVGQARLEVKSDLTLSANGKTLEFDGGGKLRNLTIEHDWLAARPLTGLRLSVDGKGALTMDGTRLHLDHAELVVGKVRAELSGDVERGAEHSVLDLKGGIPLASCQDMLDSAPQGLLPLVRGMRAEGTFSFDGSIDLDTRKAADMATRWKVANACRITATPADISPRRFSKPFSLEIIGADGRPLRVLTGPGTPEWAPLYAISEHMETAIIICEDAGFRRHSGFDHEAIQNSIRENVKAGRFLRGASTVTMQLAKNLYLAREKTLSRKLQEAVLTQLLEQELSKDEILELYLNVIEYGPGIYGIRSAARHYFNATPAQLSLGQALYLASILPNPKAQHFGEGGRVTEGWMSYLHKLMRIAVKIGRLSELELEEALAEQVTFGVAESPYATDEAPPSSGLDDAPSPPTGLTEGRGRNETPAPPPYDEAVFDDDVLPSPR